METASLPQLIEKELISELTFRDTEAEVQNPMEIRRQLAKALILGNSLKHKVRLTFDSDAGLKMVHTTIWGMGESRIILKKGVSIPIDSVVEVRLL